MKKSIISVITTAIFCLSALSLHAAVKIVECEDEKGNKTFAKSCPPGFSVIGEKKIATGKGKSEAVNPKSIAAKIYLIPDCAACEEAKEYLNSKKLNLTVINAAEDIKYQNEVKELAGELRVPIVVIGEDVIKGYNRSEVDRILEEKGVKAESNEDNDEDD